ncbi:biotin-dependent carboxyltransferase family protein [Aeromicrobium sp. YIM 150415]|uniref:5-oxoprolinase subunit C family protein n=1 Tax=Aeromicrobium sp. YIM 150415 TaxID=2803912 RepID=UPI0019654292|nr:biotin-dependent carboxyltransferase family protein [Aeromicrobium sp. YIM 150415]MBM9465447.1 biotin-dependent carboxyltransferase family protein [Aeromicrobium sp. YIM 150415]
MTTLEVLATGPQATVQDLGRPGYAAMGVGRSGAADRRSFALAQRLVGNDEALAAVEVLIGGLSLRTDEAVEVAVTGAGVEVLIDDGEGPVPMGLNARHTLRAGATLTLGQAASGLRAYVAVRGGIDVEPVLGSRATDTMSGIGPKPLSEGDRLPVGRGAGELPATDLAPVAGFDEDGVTLRAVRGPRDDWLADAEHLTRTTWTVSDKANRVGARLNPPEGATLRHAEQDRQLPSEGAARGAIQVPPSGEPVLFLADHPVTGGYPVVAVVVDEDVDRAAQLRPGQKVRFTWA